MEYLYTEYKETIYVPEENCFYDICEDIYNDNGILYTYLYKVKASTN